MFFQQERDLKVREILEAVEKANQVTAVKVGQVKHAIFALVAEPGLSIIDALFSAADLMSILTPGDDVTGELVDMNPIGRFPKIESNNLIEK